MYLVGGWWEACRALYWHELAGVRAGWRYCVPDCDRYRGGEYSQVHSKLLTDA